jgi:hypothetical protein
VQCSVTTRSELILEWDYEIGTLTSELPTLPEMVRVIIYRFQMSARMRVALRKWTTTRIFTIPYCYRRNNPPTARLLGR